MEFMNDYFMELSEEEQNLLDEREDDMFRNLNSVPPKWVKTQEDWETYARHLMHRLVQAKSQLNAVLEVLYNARKIADKEAHKEYKIADILKNNYESSKKEAEVTSKEETNRPFIYFKPN